MTAGAGDELLRIAEMYEADRLAAEGGCGEEALMEAAGRAVFDEITRRWAERPVTVLCGPGNNGGDGFVVARLLDAAGWPVTVGLLGPPAALEGAAGVNAARWRGETRALSAGLLDGAGLVVDALFGAGLARPLDGEPLAVVRELERLDAPCVSVDMPSGVHGDSGLVLGAAPHAEVTVTFFRRKPGHLLLPGRAHAGEVVVADIGIPDAVLSGIRPAVSVNRPGLWAGSFRWPRATGHKYTRGHALIAGGAAMTGAARLAARAARRVGAGLVTVAAGPECLHLYDADAPGLLTLPFATADEFAALLDDERKNAVLVGPGNGVNRTTHDLVLATAARRRALVVDADALTVFEDEPRRLFDALDGVPAVLTPHGGEFSRLFRVPGDRLTRTREAAGASGAVTVFKGADTVIAAPDGRAAINDNAPPDLATAGSGDVLAGLIVGLLAQGMEPFEAACAAVWLHGAAAGAFGPGLIAEDICDMLPRTLRRLKRGTVGGPARPARPRGGRRGPQGAARRRPEEGGPR